MSLKKTRQKFTSFCLLKLKKKRNSENTTKTNIRFSRLKLNQKHQGKETYVVSQTFSGLRQIYTDVLG